MGCLLIIKGLCYKEMEGGFDWLARKTFFIQREDGARAEENIGGKPPSLPMTRQAREGGAVNEHEGSDQFLTKKEM